MQNEVTVKLLDGERLPLQSLVAVMDNLACDLQWSLGFAIGHVMRIVDGPSCTFSDPPNARKWASRAMEQAELLLFLASLAVHILHANPDTPYGQARVGPSLMTPCPEASRQIAVLGSIEVALD